MGQQTRGQAESNRYESAQRSLKKCQVPSERYNGMSLRTLPGLMLVMMMCPSFSDQRFLRSKDRDRAAYKRFYNIVSNRPTRHTGEPVG